MAGESEPIRLHRPTLLWVAERFNGHLKDAQGELLEDDVSRMSTTIWERLSGGDLDQAADQLVAQEPTPIIFNSQNFALYGAVKAFTMDLAEALARSEE